MVSENAFCSLCRPLLHALPSIRASCPCCSFGAVCRALARFQRWLVNISSGGVLFCCDHRFPVNANEQEGKYFHGYRFIDINTKEQERMVREIFLLQRDEIRRRNVQ